MLSNNALTCPHSYTDDKNRDNIDPDKLKNGITDYSSPSPEDKEILYMFFARYVQKVHSDGAIKSELRNKMDYFPGWTYLPSGHPWCLYAYIYSH